MPLGSLTVGEKCAPESGLVASWDLADGRRASAGKTVLLLAEPLLGSLHDVQALVLLTVGNFETVYAIFEILGVLAQFGYVTLTNEQGP